MRDITDYRLDMDGDFNVAAVVARPEPLAEPEPLQENESQPSPRITLRLTVEENEQLRDLAAGMTISAYVRDCVFGDYAAKRKRKSYAPIQNHVALAQMLAMLGESRFANNLNQLAHQANIGNLEVDEDALSQLEETYRHVIDMRETLIRTLGLLEDA